MTNWCSTCNSVAKYFCVCNKWFCKGCYPEHTQIHKNEVQEITDNSKLIVVEKDEPELRKI